ncbi:hypothetical protein Daus18300_004542 [Diaporthe australafricana]|uniref:2EXR domain-containing protein n=1 Tax=Diaporthe australafricana TaxID=127596 RepID=A0ABR3X7J5_9PEZI
MPEFLPFQRLPKELRDEIWDLAIRDDGAGVQFFTIFDIVNDSNSVVLQAQRVHATSGAPDLSYRVGFAAPQLGRVRQLSWTNGNVSSYLTDSGLWTACFESRQRMMVHFQPYKTSPQLSKHAPEDAETVKELCKSPKASVNMKFKRENGELQYLTIRPSADLLCFQLAKNSAFSWASSFQWSYISDFPLFRWRAGGTGWQWESSAIKNIAVEFDPSWASVDREGEWSFTRARTSLGAVENVTGVTNFWLIDYSLARRYRTSSTTDRRGRSTFRASGGLEFVEVLDTDDEWSPHVCHGGTSGCGCVDVAEGAAVHHLTWELQLMQNLPATYADILNGQLVNFGVLACVDPKLDRDLPVKGEWMVLNERMALWDKN